LPGYIQQSSVLNIQRTHVFKKSEHQTASRRTYVLIMSHDETQRGDDQLLVAPTPPREQVRSPKEFLDLTTPEFRLWMVESDLEVVEAALPSSSSVKPSDLASVLFTEGPMGFHAMLQDEVIDGVKLKKSMVERTRVAIAAAAKMERPSSSSGGSRLSGSSGSSRCSSDAPTKNWNTMVANNERASSTGLAKKQKRLEEELLNGKTYVFSENSAPHGKDFADDPKKVNIYI
jgi:hypothetical protein